MRENWKSESYIPQIKDIVILNINNFETNEIINIPICTDVFQKFGNEVGVWKIKKVI